MVTGGGPLEAFQSALVSSNQVNLSVQVAEIQFKFKF